MNVLFDFDGTLVDSFQCVAEKAILLAKEYNFRKISDHDIESLRELSSKELIKFLDIPIYKIPSLIAQMRRHLYNAIPTLAPINGIPELLEKLHKAKFSMGILTSNSVENVNRWLDINQMQHFFNFIHIESRYFSKKSLIKKTLRTYQLEKSQTCYIGDETRDIEAAHKNQIQSVAVTWGYNSEKALLKYKPTFIAKTPEDILRAIALS